MEEKNKILVIGSGEAARFSALQRILFEGAVVIKDVIELKEEIKKRHGRTIVFDGSLTDEITVIPVADPRTDHSYADTHLAYPAPPKLAEVKIAGHFPEQKNFINGKRLNTKKRKIKRAR